MHLSDVSNGVTIVVGVGGVVAATGRTVLTRLKNHIDLRFSELNARSDTAFMLSVRAHQRLDKADIADLQNGAGWLSTLLKYKSRENPST